MTNEQEDKAELGATIESHGLTSTICQADILLNKASLLLARLKVWYPGYGQYLLQTSSHCIKKGG
jgi:hypothetical protein